MRIIRPRSTIRPRSGLSTNGAAALTTSLAARFSQTLGDTYETLGGIVHDADLKLVLSRESLRERIAQRVGRQGRLVAVLELGEDHLQHDDGNGRTAFSFKASDRAMLLGGAATWHALYQGLSQASVM